MKIFGAVWRSTSQFKGIENHYKILNINIEILRRSTWVGCLFRLVVHKPTLCSDKYEQKYEFFIKYFLTY